MSGKLFASTILVGGIALASMVGGTVNASALSKTQENAVVKMAKAERGVPYKYGGTSTRGFDCSGLAQYVYKHAAHKSLPRTSEAQYSHVTHVSWANRKPGDLVFFKEHGDVGHVGIYIGVINHHSMMIAAPYTGKNVREEVIYSSYWKSRATISFGRVK